MIGQGLDTQRTAISVLQWGREGTGKTTNGLSMVKTRDVGNVVLINAEAGAKRQALIQHGIDPKRIEVWPPEDKGPGYITYDTLVTEVVNPMRAALAKDPDAYIGVVIDSFTEVARRLLELAVAEAYAAAQAMGKKRSRWFVGLEDHGVAASQMRSLLRAFRDLNVHLVITALERRDVDQDTSAVTYGPAMGPAVGTDTMGLVDLVGFCQVERFGETDFWTSTFTPSPTRRAKDRFGLMPVSMVDPTFDRILGYVEGEINRDNDTSRARLLKTIADAKNEAPSEPDAAKPEPGTSPAEAAADETVDAQIEEKETVNA